MNTLEGRVKGVAGLAALGALSLLTCASAQAATEPTWLEQLPPAADVTRSIRGADAAETATRQRTAFRVLIKLIEGMTGVSRMQPERLPPIAALRATEYEAGLATVQGGTRADLELPARHAELYEHQKAALDVLVPRALVDAYFNTRAGRHVWLEALERATEARAAAERRDAQAARPTVRVRASTRFAPDVAAATKANLDVSVVGIQLGAPLGLPDCSSRPGGQTCRVQPTATVPQGFATASAIYDQRPDTSFISVPETRLEVVRLADAKCPTWLDVDGSCHAYVTVQDDVALAVLFTVESSKQPKISAQLRGKYGTPSGQGSASEWSLPGLYVSYNPTRESNSDRGEVKVELASYHRATQQADTRLVDVQARR